MPENTLRSNMQVKMLIIQSCLTLCHPMDCSPPFSVHGSLQARILDGVTVSSSRESSQPQDRSWVSHIAGRFITIWTTRESPKQSGGNSKSIDLSLERPGFNHQVYSTMAFPGGSDVKNLPAMWKTPVQSLGWEDTLEKGMAIYSSILACRIPWTEVSGGLQSVGLQRVGHDWASNTLTHARTLHGN